eukprot:NODE_715_length_4836_cov_0.118640.p3 type:complete len:332 gc:universal NODE_715_length_4836_cov_0.118640:1154-159(-)
MHLNRYLDWVWPIVIFELAYQYPWWSMVSQAFPFTILGHFPMFSFLFLLYSYNVYNKALEVYVEELLLYPSSALLENIFNNNYGFIYKVNYTDSDGRYHEYARKKFNFLQFVSIDYLRNVYLNEINFMNRLNHPNIVKIIRYYDDEFLNLEYIMELAEEDAHSLFSKLNPVMDSDEFKQKLLLLLTNIVDALDYLHNSEYIAHMDVKLENIVWIRDSFKLIDFGFAVNSQYITGAKGTPRYRASEVVDESQGYNAFKADIYSLGSSIKGINVPIDMDIKCTREDEDIRDNYIISKEFSDIINWMTRCDSELRPDTETLKTSLQYLSVPNHQ